MWALSVDDPKGAEALRHLDMVKFKEVLQRKFLDPWRALGPIRVLGKP